MSIAIVKKIMNHSSIVGTGKFKIGDRTKVNKDSGDYHEVWIVVDPNDPIIPNYAKNSQEDKIVFKSERDGYYAHGSEKRHELIK